ncbi:hypothetical protein [Streptomyces sp. NPDC001068]|uniref:hypothetical protein n=1 Tax=Streptomyces sp. NPDC001068 TaxID=3364544 RepID=UPI0036C1F2DE
MDAARLYEGKDHSGKVVEVAHEGDGPTAYSLSHLGISRLASLKAPKHIHEGMTVEDQHWATEITVWAEKPKSRYFHAGQEYATFEEDAADLGEWADKAKYVRVERVLRDPSDDQGGFMAMSENEDTSIKVIE